LAQDLAGFDIDHDRFVDQSRGEPNGRMMCMSMVARVPGCLGLAGSEHHESSNGAGAAAGKNSRQTSGYDTGRITPIARKGSHSTTPHSPVDCKASPIPAQSSSDTLGKNYTAVHDSSGGWAERQPRLRPRISIQA